MQTGSGGCSNPRGSESEALACIWYSMSLLSLSSLVPSVISLILQGGSWSQVLERKTYNGHKGSKTRYDPYCCSPKAASDAHHLLPPHPSRLTSFLSGPSAGLGFLLVRMTHTFTHERSQPWCPTWAIVAVTAHLWTQKHQELPCESPVT